MWRQSCEAEQKRLRMVIHAQVVVHSDQIAIKAPRKGAHRYIGPESSFLFILRGDRDGFRTQRNLVSLFQLLVDQRTHLAK